MVCVLSPIGFLLAGGIAMCCLYKPGERLDALGYWILFIMVLPSILAGLLWLICGLIWGSPGEPDDDDTDEA